MDFRKDVKRNHLHYVKKDRNSQQSCSGSTKPHKKKHHGNCNHMVKKEGRDGGKEIYVKPIYKSHVLSLKSYTCSIPLVCLYMSFDPVFLTWF